MDFKESVPLILLDLLNTSISAACPEKGKNSNGDY